MRVCSPSTSVDPEDIPETAVIAKIHEVKKVGAGKLNLEEEILQGPKTSSELQTPRRLEERMGGWSVKGKGSIQSDSPDLDMERWLW